MDRHTIVDQADDHSVIENVSCDCVALGFSHDVQMNKVEAGAAVIPLSMNFHYCPADMPFSE